MAKKLCIVLALAMPCCAQQVGLGDSTNVEAGTATLVASVERTAGSLRDSGTITFAVSPGGTWSERWTTPAQQYSVKSIVQDGSRGCEQTDKSGTSKEWSDSECYRAVPWFAPWVALTVSNGQLQSMPSGASGTTNFQIATPDLAHVAKKAAANLQWFQKATAVSVTYDPATKLANRMDFKIYPDSASPPIDVSIVYDDYRMEGSTMIPHHMTRYVQRTKDLDLHVTSVSFQ